MYLCLTVLGLHCCAWAFSSCSELVLLFVAVCRLLTAVASLVEHRLEVRVPLVLQSSVAAVRGLSSCAQGLWSMGLSSCGSRAQLPHGVWNIPGPGIKHTSPALADRFLTTDPPGKSCLCI